jgi:2-dehydro-3-deoxygluconokinase
MAMITPEQPEPLEVAHNVLIRSGGAESNVAMYLASLGHRVSWLSRLGDDPLGRRVLREIAATGVLTPFVQMDPDAPTGVYFKDPGPDSTRVFYYRRGSAASFMSLELLMPLTLHPPRVLHVSGITPALSPQCDEMMSGLFAEFGPSGTAISFDVNYRESLWWPDVAAPRLLELARQADIVFVGADEGRALWGMGSPQELRSLFDPRRTLIVKDGAFGATVFHGDVADFVPSLKVAVREPVGAGDAFAAGWLSGFLRDLPHHQRLRLGHLLASLALASTADHHAVPSDRWLQAALATDEAEWKGALSGALSGEVEACDLLNDGPGS